MADEVIPLSRYRADVARALARRGRDLLSAANLAEAVAALAPLESYFIVKELGVDAAVPLLLHATSEQLQALTDLDCWQGDRLAPEELDAWLAPFAAEGPETLADVFSRLDHELQTVFLASSLRVYDPREDAIPDVPPSVTLARTPDDAFVLEVTAGEREVEPLLLVQALYRRSPEDAFGLCTAVKWEAGAVTEEEAYRLRCGRIADLGFPPPEEAASLFAPPPRSLRSLGEIASPPPTSLPAAYARALVQEALVTRALARVTDAALLERLERDLVYLVNAAVTAYGDSPRDLAHVGEIAGRVRDTLSLGLEVLAASAGPVRAQVDADDAVAALARWHLRDVFRVGHAQVAPLARAAADLAADPVLHGWLEQPCREGDEYSAECRERAFLRALLLPRPLHGGYDALAPDKVRAFGSRREIEEAEQRLAALRERHR